MIKHWSDAMDSKDGTGEGYDPVLESGYDESAVMPEPPAGSRASAALARIRRHEAALERAQRDLARYEALPGEPEVEEGEPNVIWFSKVFQNGSRIYAYSAVKAGDGLWYTSGPHTPKGFPWQKLIEWIADGESFEIWHAVGYAPL